MTLPAACAASPTCACVCPPSSSTAFGCTFAGGNTGGFCSCTDTNGMLTVTCAGVFLMLSEARRAPRRSPSVAMEPHIGL